MLRVFRTSEELAEAEKLTGESLPDLLCLHMSLKLRAAGSFPESPIEVCAYPWPDVKCWISIKRNTLAEPYVGVHLVNGGTDNDAVMALESADIDNIDEFYVFNTERSLANHLTHVLSKKYRSIDKKGDLNTTFYMPPEVHAEIADRELTLPDGYRFCNLDPEIDAPLVSSTWKFARDDDVHFTRQKLRHLPSVGVKYGDQLVAFEMVCPSGVMNHLYTLPEFRGKGIGTAVELKLCQKLIAIGVWPCKWVEIDNLKGTEWSMKSGYWRQIIDETTKEAVEVDFIILVKR